MVVVGADFQALIAIVARIAEQQGTSDTLPSAALYDSGDIAQALADLPSMIATVEANRLSVDVAGATLTTSDLVSVRTDPWSTAVKHELTVSFANEDEARWFFNSGGQIRFDASRTGGSGTSQNTDWTNLLTNIGTVYMNHSTTQQTGSGGFASSIGYYSLTDTYEQLFTQSGSGAYETNDYIINARREDYTGVRGGNGATIRLQVMFNDDHANIHFDTVDGTLTSRIGMRRATAFVSITSPSMTTVTPIT
ncbi:MAG: hypothetical protein CTR53_10365 [Ferrovibrio sp.]|nr:MAG: hypothetical protein CTR53_10365 [Ferrovibrio sp.]